MFRSFVAVSAQVIRVKVLPLIEMLELVPLLFFEWSPKHDLGQCGGKMGRFLELPQSLFFGLQVIGTVPIVP
jgi:hypothetical protein